MTEGNLVGSLSRMVNSSLVQLPRDFEYPGENPQFYPRVYSEIWDLGQNGEI